MPIYVSAPPTLRPAPAASEWRVIGQPLTLAESHVFPADTGSYPDLDRVYFADLLALHGVHYRDELLDGPRTTYREMMVTLLDRLGSRAADFDVAVLATDTPDAEPGWPMPLLVERNGGRGLAFAVSDQGPLAPFTALALLANLTPVAPGARALFFVMDQPARQHDEPVPAQRQAARNAAVVLGFGPGPQRTARVLVRGGIGAREAATELKSELETGRDPIVVVGAALRDMAGGAARVAEPGAPCTGVWAAAVAAIAESGDRTIVVADHDRELGYLGLCVIEQAQDGQ